MSTTFRYHGEIGAPRAPVIPRDRIAMNGTALLVLLLVAAPLLPIIYQAFIDRPSSTSGEPVRTASVWR